MTPVVNGLRDARETTHQELGHEGYASVCPSLSCHAITVAVRELEHLLTEVAS